MRIRVVDVLDLLASGLSQEQVLEELPDLESEDIQAALKYASSKVDRTLMTQIGRITADKIIFNHKNLHHLRSIN